jgi:hypothetical protein
VVEFEVVVCGGASSLAYVIIICMTSRKHVPTKSDKTC